MKAARARPFFKGVRAAKAASLRVPCAYCEATDYACSCHAYTSDTRTGLNAPGVIGDCAGFHLPKQTVRLVCACGRSPCLPTQEICVHCWDEDEAEYDALHGLYSASVAFEVPDSD